MRRDETRDVPCLPYAHTCQPSTLQEAGAARLWHHLDAAATQRALVQRGLSPLSSAASLDVRAWRGPRLRSGVDGQRIGGPNYAKDYRPAIAGKEAEPPLTRASGLKFWLPEGRWVWGGLMGGRMWLGWRVPPSSPRNREECDEFAHHTHTRARNQKPRGRLPSFEELLELAYGSDTSTPEQDPLRLARAHVRACVESPHPGTPRRSIPSSSHPSTTLLSCFCLFPSFLPFRPPARSTGRPPTTPRRPRRARAGRAWR